MELTREQHVAAARLLRVGQFVRYEPGEGVDPNLAAVVGRTGSIWRAPRSGAIRASVRFEWIDKHGTPISMSAPVLAGYLVTQ